MRKQIWFTTQCALFCFLKEDSQIFKTFGKILCEYIFFSLRSTGNRSTSGGDTLVRFRSLLVHGQAIPVVACGGWIQMMQRHHRYAGASCADNAKLPNENLPRHIFRRQFSFELRLPTLGDAVESNQKKKVHIDGEFHASRVPTKKKNPHLVQPISFHPCPHGSICVCRCCCCFIFLLYSCFDNSPLRPLRTWSGDPGQLFQCAAAPLRGLSSECLKQRNQK
jgi:hypothetical protein